MITDKTYRNEINQRIGQHSQDDWRGWYSVTLTLKQCLRVMSEDRTGTLAFHIDEDTASQNMRHFLNLINKLKLILIDADGTTILDHIIYNDERYLDWNGSTRGKEFRCHF